VDRLTIIGMGLIGTSFGLALKKAKVRNLEIVGHDLEPTNSLKAQKRGALDRVERNIFSAIKGSKIIVLAIPVMAIKEMMELIGPYIEEGTIVTDTGSTKSQVINWADEILPDGVNFIGGHPMAGREISGPDGADENLFSGAIYAICPSPTAEKFAQKYVVDLAEAMGAIPYFVGADEHDVYVAGISHLPFMLSIGLMNTTAKNPAWREMSMLAASGYRDPIMHRDICLTNQEGIVYWIDEIIKQLYEFRNNIRDNPDGLELSFIQAWESRARWLAQKESGYSPREDLPSSSDTMMSMVMGDKIATRLQELTQEQARDQTKYRKG
jgi:prephenate dehydrogenase